MVGYDWVLSIEHEDSLMSQNEGFEKAIAFLKHAVITRAARRGVLGVEIPAGCRLLLSESRTPVNLTRASAAFSVITLCLTIE